MTKFSLSDLLQGFYSTEISVGELEEMIEEAVASESPESGKVKEIRYHEGGVEVIVERGGSIEIEIDWQEVILT